MIVFNKNMFEYCKKTKGLTNKAIAQMAKVDERTVGKIKKNGALNPDTAEKIAIALSKSVEEMVSDVPEETKESRDIKRDRELTAIAYGVTSEFITRNAHLFFGYIAEEFLAERSKKVKETESLFADLFSSINNNGKEFNSELLDVFLGGQHREFKYHIDCEKSAIERRDLRGPKTSKNQNDLFVDWFANNMYTIFNTDDLPTADKLGIEEINDYGLFSEETLDGIDILLEPPANYDGEKEEVFKGSGDYQPMNYNRAKEILRDFFPICILPSEIPPTLRKPENYSKMLTWIIDEHQRRTKEKSDE